MKTAFIALSSLRCDLRGKIVRRETNADRTQRLRSGKVATEAIHPAQGRRAVAACVSLRRDTAHGNGDPPRRGRTVAHLSDLRRGDHRSARRLIYPMTTNRHAVPGLSRFVLT